MQQLLNYRMRIIIQDNREMIGQLMAFDKHMNIVLADCEEFRRVGGKGKNKEEKIIKRTLGLTVLRGEVIISMSIEGPPPPEEHRARGVAAGTGGPGTAKAAGRGVIVPPSVRAPAGLAAPPKGLGGPQADMMMPRGAAPPGFPGGAPPPGFPGGAPPAGFGFPPGGPPGGFPGGAPPPGFPGLGRGGPPGGFPGGPPPGFRGGPPPGFPGPAGGPGGPPGGPAPGGMPPPGFRGGPPPGTRGP
eukprot:TRINITY_DN15393_c0_g1_i1.p1 TRINITY_DN15393_c0_g1~~TRINITY_DN15393_c0_g1_i1.p1  ORF type:complete len:263 (+),score=89.91 TRINITY_DN15393_c0_g1_i1:60-791(+)